MQNASWMVLIFFGSLFSTTAFADDVSSSGADILRPSVTASAPETLPLDSAYWSRWQPSHRITSMAYASEPSVPIGNLVFQDIGAFLRVSKARELSLLTLAEVGSTRLYFGVSDAGLLGIHLGALPRYDDRRCLELVRMPYLKGLRRSHTVE